MALGLDFIIVVVGVFGGIQLTSGKAIPAEPSEKEIHDRVASLEYAGAVRALVPFVIPAMLLATVYVIGATGTHIFSTYAIIPPPASK